MRTLLTLAMLAGCDKSDGDSGDASAGYQLYENFPLDGQRRWVYANDDEAVGFNLEVELVSSEVLGDAEVFELAHIDQGSGAPLRSVWWSSDSSAGVQIHAYAEGGGGRVDLDPPVTFAQPRMDPGDEVTSGAGGWDFTSTFVGGEPCANHWVGDDWDRCLHVRLDDGDGDDGAGAPFAGDYWLVPRYGAAWLETTGDSDTWVLLNAFWEP